MSMLNMISPTAKTTIMRAIELFLGTCTIVLFIVVLHDVRQSDLRNNRSLDVKRENSVKFAHLCLSRNEVPIIVPDIKGSATPLYVFCRTADGKVQRFDPETNAIDVFADIASAMPRVQE